MGTNYYVEQEACACCHRGPNSLHLGKSSGGWRFSLHVIPELGLNDLKAWRKFLKGKKIVDEYGSRITQKGMLEIITMRRGDVGKGPPPSYCMGGGSEWSSWEAYAEATSAEVDWKHGLLKHKLLEGHCVGHGPGPWDYIVGEFS